MKSILKQVDISEVVEIESFSFFGKEGSTLRSINQILFAKIVTHPSSNQTYSPISCTKVVSEKEAIFDIDGTGKIGTCLKLWKLVFISALVSNVCFVLLNFP